MRVSEMDEERKKAFIWVGMAGRQWVGPSWVAAGKEGSGITSPDPE
jgi:hypothetical protein